MRESIYEFDQEKLSSSLVVTAVHYKGGNFAILKYCCLTAYLSGQRHEARSQDVFEGLQILREIILIPNGILKSFFLIFEVNSKHHHL